MFPQATATDIIHSGIRAGKLNGGMPTTTPMGSRKVRQSTSREMSVKVCPISWEGMPQANSTTSSPRAASHVRLAQQLAVFADDAVCHVWNSSFPAALET